MNNLITDVRYALRSSIQRPGLTLIITFTLALGIGANTAIFSIANAVLLRPLPFKEPDRRILVRQSFPKLYGPAVNLSCAEFIDYRDRNQVFSQTAGFTDFKANLTGLGEPQRVQAARVSAVFSPTLDVAPALGSGFSAEEDQPGRNDVVVLTNALWRRQFGADPSIIGKPVSMDGRPYTVVGVMPSSFQFPYREFAVRTALGATRFRLARQFISENLVLALVAGGVGVLLSFWGVDALISLNQGNRPRADEIGVNARPLAFTFVLSTLVAVAIGLLPLLRFGEREFERRCARAFGQQEYPVRQHG